MKAIAAVSINGVIGQGNKIPWRLPVDLAHFRDLTGKDKLVMGNNTFKSLPKELPNRDHLILTRTLPENPVYMSDTANQIKFVTEDQVSDEDLLNAWLIGGQQIYSLLSDKVDELHITLILIPFIGNIMFPWGSYNKFELTDKSPIRISKNNIPYTFLKYQRRKNV